MHTVVVHMGHVHTHFATACLSCMAMRSKVLKETAFLPAKKGVCTLARQPHTHSKTFHRLWLRGTSSIPKQASPYCNQMAKHTHACTHTHTHVYTHTHTHTHNTCQCIAYTVLKTCTDHGLVQHIHIRLLKLKQNE